MDDFTCSAPLCLLVSSCKALDSRGSSLFALNLLSQKITWSTHLFQHVSSKFFVFVFYKNVLSTKPFYTIFQLWGFSCLFMCVYRADGIAQWVTMLSPSLMARVQSLEAWMQKERTHVCELSFDLHMLDVAYVCTVQSQTLSLPLFLPLLHTINKLGSVKFQNMCLQQIGLFICLKMAQIT